MAGFGGVETVELNHLEEVFLEILDFDIHICEDDFAQYKLALNLHFIQEPDN